MRSSTAEMHRTFFFIIERYILGWEYLTADTGEYYVFSAKISTDGRAFGKKETTIRLSFNLS